MHAHATPKQAIESLIQDGVGLTDESDQTSLSGLSVLNTLTLSAS